MLFTKRFPSFNVNLILSGIGGSPTLEHDARRFIRNFSLFVRIEDTRQAISLSLSPKDVGS